MTILLRRSYQHLQIFIKFCKQMHHVDLPLALLFGYDKRVINNQIILSLTSTDFSHYPSQSNSWASEFKPCVKLWSSMFVHFEKLRLFSQGILELINQSKVTLGAIFNLQEVQCKPRHSINFVYEEDIHSLSVLERKTNKKL